MIPVLTSIAPDFTDGVRHFKEEGGRSMVCDAVEEYAKKRAEEAAIETTIEDAISYGISKEQIIKKVTEKYGIDAKEAEILYNTYAKQAI